MDFGILGNQTTEVWKCRTATSINGAHYHFFRANHEVARVTTNQSASETKRTFQYYVAERTMPGLDNCEVNRVQATRMCRKLRSLVSFFISNFFTQNHHTELLIFIVKTMMKVA